MNRTELQRELSDVDDLLQKEIKKKDRKQIIQRLEKLMARVKKYADRGDIPKEAALRMRVDLCQLAKQVKKKNQDKASSRQRVHELVEHIISMYQSRPESKPGAGSEEKLMAMLFRSFK
jgi:RecG-like helicase